MTERAGNWHCLSADPNSRAAVVHRQGVIRSARRNPVRDRNRYLVSLAAGKSVLDIGAVEHEAKKSGSCSWLHGEIAAASRSVLGLDVLDGEVKELQQRGFRVACLDVTTPGAAASLGETFELVLAGEVVEHLSEPLRLLEFCRDSMAPDGITVITTPNPYFLGAVLRHWTGRANENVDHTILCFPSGMVELAERVGLRLKEWRGSLIAGVTAKQRLLFRWARSLRWPPLEIATCTTLVFEFTSNGKG